jgi:hypothetical protein
MKLCGMTGLERTLYFSIAWKTLSASMVLQMTLQPPAINDAAKNIIADSQ